MLENKKISIASLVKKLDDTMVTLRDRMQVTSKASLRIPEHKDKYSTYKKALTMSRSLKQSLKERNIGRKAATKVMSDIARLEAKADAIELMKAAKIEYSDKETSTPEIDTHVSKASSIDMEQLGELKSQVLRMPKGIRGMYGLAEVPVIPMFRNYKHSDYHVLRKAGFNVTQMSDDFAGYAILQDERVFIFDYEKYLESYSRSVEEQEADFVRQMDLWKEAHAKHNSELFEYEAAQRKYNRLYERWINPELYKEKFDRRMLKYKKEINLYKNGLREDKPKKPVFRMPSSEPVAPVEVRPFTANKPNRHKVAPAVARDSISDVVLATLRTMNELLGTKYVLMSEQSRPNPNNISHQCYWVVEQWKLDQLLSVGQVTVTSWDFGFN